jgi:hypothetical protein
MNENGTNYVTTCGRETGGGGGEHRKRITRANCTSHPFKGTTLEQKMKLSKAEARLPTNELLCVVLMLKMD